MKKVKNPWLNISWTNTVADCDKEYIVKKYGSLTEYEKRYKRAGLDLSCLPEPYSGNRESQVFCLNMNPGESIPRFHLNKAFETETLKNLEHKVNDCYWFRRVLDNDGFPHPGLFWLHEKTKKLYHFLGRRPNIFFVEYFPYHSKSGSGIIFPSDLPSYEYSNMLINDVIEEKKKIIIIMRMHELWFDRIKGLSDYPHLILVKNQRSGWLSPGNFIYPNSKPLTDEQIIKQF